ncbi:MAG TPA: SAF domain-containing protein [Streptosporangiaceae bacterium]|nr:SAF domain-containing protein [Streptosporangiaceae bacterium]
MSQTTGVSGRSPDGRFGAATPGLRAERPSIDDLVAAQNRGAGRRRYTSPRRLTALAVAILVAGGAYALGRYVIAPRPPHTIRLVVTAVPLPAGAKVSAADLRVVTVDGAKAPAGLLSPSAAAGVIGLVARNAVPAGTFLSRSMLSPAGGVPDASQAIVGLALKPGQLPAGGLAVGQKVLVVLLPVNSQGVPLSPISLINTTVWDLQPPDAGGNQDAAVIVPSSMASKLSSYAARGEVSLVATSAPPAPSTTPSPKPTVRVHSHSAKAVPSKASSHK